MGVPSHDIVGCIVFVEHLLFFFLLIGLTFLYMNGLHLGISGPTAFFQYYECILASLSCVLLVLLARSVRVAVEIGVAPLETRGYVGSCIDCLPKVLRHAGLGFWVRAPGA